MRQPTTAAVKYWFDYLSTSGELIWKVAPGSRSDLKGEVAGTIGNTGYRKIWMGGHVFQAHRLVWLWHGNKLDPKMDIDHVNGDKLDNRIENLRQVDHKTNTQNRRRPLPLYVYKQNSNRRPFYVVIDGKRRGSFYSLEAAVAAVDSFISNNEQPNVREPRGSIQAFGGLHPRGNPTASGDGQQTGVGDLHSCSRDAGQSQPGSDDDSRGDG